MRLALCLLLCCAVSAQEKTIRSSGRLVIAPTNVKDATGRSVDGLTAEDFILMDNGVRRPVQLDVTFLLISLAIVVQTSGNSFAALRNVAHIGGMLEPLITGAGGSAAVIAYADEIQQVQELTTEFDRVKEKLSRLKANRGSGQRNIDAVGQSIRLVANDPVERRRIILIIGESKNTGSKAKLTDIVTLAQQQNVLIYAVHYSR